MRAFFVIAALVILAYCLFDSEKSETPCSECPNGVCPLEKEIKPVNYIAPRADYTLSTPALLPKLVADYTVFAATVAQPIAKVVHEEVKAESEIKGQPLVPPHINIRAMEESKLQHDLEFKFGGDPIVGKNGWRMRLFFPSDSESIARTIDDEIRLNYLLWNFAKENGYQAFSTEGDYFRKGWKRSLPADEVSLVLVDPDNRIVFTSHRVLKDGNELLASLQEKRRQFSRRSQFNWQPNWQSVQSMMSWKPANQPMCACKL